MDIAILILLSINVVLTALLSIVLLSRSIKSYVYDELDNCNYYGEENDRL